MINRVLLAALFLALLSGCEGLPPAPQGTKVYAASECMGPVIAGRCHGAILPMRAYHPTCYGQMIGGQCTGPMF